MRVASSQAIPLIYWATALSIWIVVPWAHDPFIQPKLTWLGLVLLYYLGFGLIWNSFRRVRSQVMLFWYIVAWAIVSGAFLFRGDWNNQIFEVSLSGTYILILLVTPRIDWRLWIWPISFAALGEATWVILQAMGLDPYNQNLSAWGSKWHQYGTLGNPNRVGWFLSGTLVFLLGAIPDLIEEGLSKLRWLYLNWILIMCFGATLLTVSRGSIFALAMAVSILSYSHSSPWRRKYRILLEVGVLIFFICFAVAYNTTHASWASSLLNWDSIQGRWIHLKEVWVLFLERPWFGIGLGQFSLRAQMSSIYTDSVYSVEYVHNEYLGILLELGIVGAAPLFIGIVKTFLSAKREKLPWMGVLLYYFIVFLYDFPLREPSTLLLFGLAILGTIAHPPRSYSKSIQVNRLYLSPLFLFLGYIFINPFLGSLLQGYSEKAVSLNENRKALYWSNQIESWKLRTVEFEATQKQIKHLNAAGNPLLQKALEFRKQ